MKLKLAFLAFLAAPPVQAGQSISESLVDCAALFELSQRAAPERRETQKGAKIAYASDQLRKAARQRAREEGRTNPDKYVDDLICLKEAKWDQKGVTYGFSQDFRDWVQYCRALSDHLGIKLSMP